MTVSNLSGVAQTITGQSFALAGADEFTVTGGTCPKATVPSQKSCTYEITFSPTSTMSVGVQFFVASKRIDGKCTANSLVDILAPGVPLPSPTPTPKP
jgi:hypothetical protein